MQQESVDLLYGSRAPGMKWWDRIDPVHEVTWADTIGPQWNSVSVYRNVLKFDRTGRLVHDVEHEWSPIQMSDGALYSERAIRIMALLHEWTMLSTFQIATLIGTGRRAAWNTLSVLYSAGLTERLTPKWYSEGMTPEQSGSGSLWRIDRKSWTTERWFEGLGNLEWALVTNGADPTQSAVGAITPSAVRHNLIASEIAIKAMEAAPGIAGVWGEPHAGSPLMYQALESESDAVRSNVGDAVLITKSGRIIVLEVTGSGGSSSNFGQGLIEKAAAWTAICGKSPLDLYVVFVEASTESRMSRFTKLVDIGVQRESMSYVAHALTRERGQSRVLVADSRDWFPVARTVSTAFAALRCRSPITGAEVDLIGPEDMDAAWVPPVTNVLASLTTPLWIVNQPAEQS